MFGKRSNPFEPELDVGSPPHIERSNISHEIKQLARAEHPGDFATQKYVVEQQTEAYAWLASYKPLRVPEDELVAIRKNAAREHPQDYCTQKYVIEQQVEAYLWMLDN